MEYLKYIISVAVGAFIVGLGFISFLDSKIDKRIEATKFELIESETQKLRSSWVESDHLCHLTCPSGFVLKEFGYESPQNEQVGDCNKFQCVKLSVQTTKPNY